MAHTLTQLSYHCVFSTKERYGFLSPDISDHLNRYMAGIASNHNMHLIRAGGIENHRHLLLQLHPSVSISIAMTTLKANSSRWIKQTYPEMEKFGWQSGYAAFSVSPSLIPKVVAYIDNQQQHHRQSSFEEEYLKLLEKHGIEFDSEYVFG